MKGEAQVFSISEEVVVSESNYGKFQIKCMSRVPGWVALGEAQMGLGHYRASLLAYRWRAVTSSTHTVGDYITLHCIITTPCVAEHNLS